jgi:hypothetical protein
MLRIPVPETPGGLNQPLQTRVVGFSNDDAFSIHSLFPPWTSKTFRPIPEAIAAASAKPQFEWIRGLFYLRGFAPIFG